MSRALDSVVPIVVGALLSAPALLPGFSMSNVVNLLQVIVGGCLVAFGIVRWNAPPSASARPKEVAAAFGRHHGAVKQPEFDPRASLVTPRTSAPTKSPLRRWYLAYLKYLFLLPIALTAATGLASKFAGCRWTAATMKIHNCGGAGQFFTEVFIYVGLFSGAMLTLLIPLTIVYGAAVLNDRKRNRF